MPATDHQPDFAEKAKLFGDKVRSRRAELGLSERRLAERASLSRGYISLLLKDRGSHKDAQGEFKLPNPTLDVIWRLADALEVEPAYLVDSSRPVERH
ncbi:helix-turn-helix domain-containing protein [Nocardioides alcanivorans]|uniref:helix-turn-helix domain-containing protein n=1 Tax=Nocardioides alcanivorans TaxID=2897352 RepID=UPI001F18BEB3|nr:helix-turn-helix transcriptional regulator [Nocardioides alcanivorans]